MTIYDKASWQIDNNINQDMVIEHFSMVFKWLKQHDMLSKDGNDILSFGIDEDASLNSQLLNDNGNKFLSEYYDKLIEVSQYDISKEEKLLDSYYLEFTTR